MPLEGTKLNGGGQVGSDRGGPNCTTNPNPMHKGNPNPNPSPYHQLLPRKKGCQPPERLRASGPTNRQSEGQRKALKARTRVRPAKCFRARVRPSPKPHPWRKGEHGHSETNRCRGPPTGWALASLVKPIFLTSSTAWVRLGSAWPWEGDSLPPKSSWEQGRGRVRLRATVELGFS